MRPLDEELVRESTEYPVAEALKGAISFDKFRSELSRVMQEAPADDVFDAVGNMKHIPDDQKYNFIKSILTQRNKEPVTAEMIAMNIGEMLARFHPTITPAEVMQHLKEYEEHLHGLIVANSAYGGSPITLEDIRREMVNIIAADVALSIQKKYSIPDVEMDDIHDKIAAHLENL